jgi:hypothetical protein
VSPNQPGQNVVAVRAASTRKPAPAVITRVMLRFTYLGDELGTQEFVAAASEPDVYRLGGSALSLPGPWLVEVVVRRKGLSDSVADFTWNVLPDGGGADVPVSLPLQIGAGVLLVLAIAGAVRLFGRRAPVV